MAAGPSSATGGRERRCRSLRARARVRAPPAAARVLLPRPAGPSSARPDGRPHRRKLRRSHGQPSSSSLSPARKEEKGIYCQWGLQRGQRERGAARKGGAKWDPRDGEAERVATCAERAGGDCERDSWEHRWRVCWITVSLFSPQIYQFIYFYRCCWSCSKERAALPARRGGRRAVMRVHRIAIKAAPRAVRRAPCE